MLEHVAPGYDSFDLTEFVYDTDNVCLMSNGAVAIFAGIGDAAYEGHYLFPAYVRGRKALTVAKDMLRAMFTTYKARAIHGHVSRSHRAARTLTRALGFTVVGDSRDALGRECVHYLLERDAWETSLVSE